MCPRGWRPEGTATWQALNPLRKWMNRRGAMCVYCGGNGWVLELTAFGALMQVACTACRPSMEPRA